MHENISTRFNSIDFDLIQFYLYEYNRVPNKSHPYDTNQSSVHRLCHIYFKLKRFHIRYAKTHRLHEHIHMFINSIQPIIEELCTIFPFLYNP